MSVKNCFIRGSVVRYVQVPARVPAHTQPRTKHIAHTQHKRATPAAANDNLPRLKT